MHSVSAGPKGQPEVGQTTGRPGRRRRRKGPGGRGTLGQERSPVFRRMQRGKTTRLFSDIGGVFFLDLNNDFSARQNFVQRLKLCGLEVDSKLHSYRQLWCLQVPHLPYRAPWGQRHTSPLVFTQRSAASLPPTRSIPWDRERCPCVGILPDRAYRRGSAA